MARELVTIQWNIGGGKILAEDQGPQRLASYSDDGMQHIIDVVDDIQPDIVTLQETHPDIPREIAEALDYEYWVNHPVSASHIDPRFELGHGLVSDLPVRSDRLDTLHNPMWVAQWEDGSRSVGHQKGISTYHVGHENDEVIIVQNLHLTPFRSFEVEPNSPEAEPILRDAEKKVGEYIDKRLLQGDFNIDQPSLRQLLPGLFELGFDEVEQEEPTTPKGRRLDHILYAGMKVVESTVIKDVLTDHYPIVTTFELT